VVEGLEVNDFSRGLIERSTAELLAERDSVNDLGLLP
jgi:malate dehydrogenase